MAGSRIALVVTTFALFILSLSDVYWYSLKLPILTIAGSVLLMATLLVAFPGRDDAGRVALTITCAGLMAGVITNVLLVSIGFDKIAIKAPLGYLLGTSLLWIVSSRSYAHLAPVLAKGITVVLAVHCAAWCLQIAVYYLTGSYLDFTGAVSDNLSRHSSAFYSWSYHGELERFTGLYAEPANYSFPIFMMVSFRLVRNDWRPRLLDGIAVATMVCSWSMTGLLLALGLGAAVLTSRVRRTYKVLAVGVFAAISYATVSLGKSAYFIERSSKAGTDSSMHGRFVEGLEFLSRQGDAQLLVGRGLGTYDFDVGRGNGLQDSLIYTGILGTMAFLLAFFVLFRSHRVGIVAVVLWFGTFLAPPVETSPFWWVWTGAIMCASAWFSGRERAGAPLLATQPATLPVGGFPVPQAFSPRP